MSLMQIAEPGQSTAKEACATVAVGIDLGTTNSVVAIVRDGRPVAIPGPDGSTTVPSVVHYADDGSVIVGREALERAAEYPRTTIASAKRLVGRSVADLGDARRLVTYDFDETDDRVIRIRLGDGRSVTPIEVSAEILRELLSRAERALGVRPTQAVITVPAYFDDAQRQATRDAGRLAGVEVLRLLAEPTAAALAYGLDRNEYGTYAVYDLGGGTFDVSILKLVEGVFEVKATGGNSALGGDDFDRAIAQRMLDAAGHPETVDPRLVRRAVAAARAAKERLTGAEATEFALAMPDGSVFRRELSRTDFAAWIEPLLRKTRKACRRALKDAEVAPGELDGVILVGGSTRSPVVRDYVADIFGREPLADIDPDHVVALGAAAQADMLAGGSQQVTLLDVIPLSLGIETMGGVVEKLIYRNSTIPTGAKQEFTTYADNQTGFDIHVVQGERETVDGNRSLARFTLKGIPPLPAGMARVEITFVVDEDGILHVTAREKLTGIENTIEVKPSYGLTDEEVERMLLDSFEHAEEDLAARNLRIERVEADRILAATRAAMAADPELLDDAVREEIERAMAALEQVKVGDDHLAIRAAIEALDRASKPFAEKRMNRAIAAAMEGRTLAEVEHEVGS
ncbi:MAG: Fe-S protein assembly chaperone HscA [Deltaproteobacteria bacterium]|nr:MAG: Fe-S protein assembly chaperone HscA [Deltaproteobacteria bacterium]